MNQITIKFNPNNEADHVKLKSRCEAWTERYGSRIGFFSISLDKGGYGGAVVIDSPRADLMNLFAFGQPFPVCDRSEVSGDVQLTEYQIEPNGNASFSFVIDYDIKYSVVFTLLPEGASEGECDRFDNSVSVFSGEADSAEGWECVAVREFSDDSNPDEFNLSEIESMTPALKGNLSLVEEFTDGGWDEEFWSDKTEGKWSMTQACFARKEFAELARETISIF